MLALSLLLFGGAVVIALIVLRVRRSGTDRHLTAFANSLLLAVEIDRIVSDTRSRQVDVALEDTQQGRHSE